MWQLQVAVSDCIYTLKVCGAPSLQPLQMLLTYAALLHPNCMPSWIIGSMQGGKMFVFVKTSDMIIVYDFTHSPSDV